MILIDLFAGPGVGKSVTAAAIYSHFAQLGYNIELITEAAKDIVWDECPALFANQVLITGQQYQRIQRLVGKVDIAVSDSPLRLGAIYASKLSYHRELYRLILALEHELSLRDVIPMRILLERNYARKYNAEGRNQGTLAEAQNFDAVIKEACGRYPHFTLKTSEDVSEILNPIQRFIYANRIEPRQ